ncbi:neocarzinostatin apoprotein domain-containing protein [Actinokineospora sp. UTMC 2448]|uniref:neocarzinostatin apoprotein domain-containing protein n=1 Tax=Actinokineospora sp. UTMC 2448 TaxID=2268449 RepID=UPI00216409BB|nr:neocarzinostatin apoprotein domain-containing protein [Actinokineospora sp. UTMC 2448]
MRSFTWLAPVGAAVALMLAAAGVATAMPVPTVSVSPSGPYTDGQTVTVSLSGFATSTSAVLEQCHNLSGVDYCDPTTQSGLSLSGGAGSTTYTLNQDYSGEDASGNPSLAACEFSYCFIRATSNTGLVATSGRLVF